MNYRTALLVLLLAPAAPACFQELDPCAAGGPNCPATTGPLNSTNTSAIVYADGGVCPAGMVVGGGDGIGGHGVCIPADTTTPPIQLNEVDDGAATTDPCVKTDEQSLQIRTTYCSMCHSGASATMTMAGFGLVLNDKALETAVSQLVTSADGGSVRLVIPGDPDDSRLYNFVAGDVMPPAGNPHPTVSDISVIRAWIECLATEAGGTASDTSTASPTSSSDAGSASTASGNDAGAD